MNKPNTKADEELNPETAEESKARPRRPKRKLNTPVNLVLAGVLIAVVAFWLGGRGGDGSSTAATGIPEGLPSGMSEGGFPGAAGAAASAGGTGDSTTGEITSLSGSTLYVSTSDGNTVKVKVKEGATVSRNAETAARQLHPGDSVVVTGKADKAGVVRADSVSATQSGVQPSMPGLGAMPPQSDG